MSKSNKRKAKIFFIIIPLIIAGGVNWISSYLFEQNRIQTYEALRQQKENEVKSIVRAVDNLVDLAADKEMTEEQKKILRLNIVGISSQEGVHCYLMDKELNFIPDCDESKDSLDSSILYALKHCSVLRDEIHSHDNDTTADNYFSIDIEDHGNYKFYWQKVPSSHTEYIIVVGVSMEKVHNTNAIDIYKGFICTLDLILVVSMVANIFMYDRLKEDN